MRSLISWQSLSACAAEGARVIEITNRAEGMLGLFRQVVSWAATERPEVILGVGTIYDAPPPRCSWTPVPTSS